MNVTMDFKHEPDIWFLGIRSFVAVYDDVDKNNSDITAGTTA